MAMHEQSPKAKDVDRARPDGDGPPIPSGTSNNPTAATKLSSFLKGFGTKFSVEFTAKCAMALVVFLLALWPNDEPRWRTKTWQLTAATGNHSPGDPNAFRWEPVVLTPSVDEEGAMEIHGLSDGKMLIRFSKSGRHAVCCGDHDKEVYQCEIELVKGNYVHVMFFDDGAPERDFWFLFQDMDRRDSTGQLPNATFASAKTATRTQ